MKVLVLDDQEFRHQGFRRMYKDSGVEVIHARSFRQFQQWLKKDKFDIIWLDHDLGGKKDGKDAARLITQLDYKPTQVFIHSANPIGTEEMGLILSEAGVSCKRKGFDEVLRNYK